MQYRSSRFVTSHSQVVTQSLAGIKLELSLDDIKWAIVQHKKLKIKQEVKTQYPLCLLILIKPQSITVLPRKNRLRVYIDGQDKYYRLRELKRGLPDVVVKVPSSTSRIPTS
jgi:DNA-directed RNA polymerase III subunit RPC1